MRLLVAFLMLGLAFELTRWIRRRHQRQEDDFKQIQGGHGGELPAASGGGIAKVGDPGEPGRLLTTRGVETVAAMVAFLLILAAMILVLRMIVRF